MTRGSLHVEPSEPLQIARHYVRELIYGANDGIITTFAVVAGVAGGGLSLRVVLIIGAANLFADGLSMAAGNYLSISSHESVLEAQELPEEEAYPVLSGLDCSDPDGHVRRRRLPRPDHERPLVEGRHRDAASRCSCRRARVRQRTIRRLAARRRVWRLGLHAFCLPDGCFSATAGESFAARHRMVVDVREN
jgi:hypothetical protein